MDLINVAEQVRVGVKRLEWVLKLADALEQIGQLDQAKREAERRLGGVREEIGKAEARLKALGEVEEKLSAENKGKADAANAEAARVVAEARAAAKAAAEKAERDAKAAKEKAVAEAAEAARQMQVAAAKAKGEAETAVATRKDAEAKRDEARKELAVLEQKIVAAKGEIARLLN